jgi:hypothetical protein
VAPGVNRVAKSCSRLTASFPFEPESAINTPSVISLAAVRRLYSGSSSGLTFGSVRLGACAGFGEANWRFVSVGAAFGVYARFAPFIGFAFLVYGLAPASWRDNRLVFLLAEAARFAFAAGGCFSGDLASV